MLRATSVLALSLLVACGGQLDDARTPTGSHSIVANSDYDAIYAVNADEGTVSRMAVGSNAVTTFDVGAEPTRLARAGNKLFVTLRGENRIAVLKEGKALTEVASIETGAEPFGVVASEEGDRVFATVSREGKVLEIDTKTNRVLRTWENVAGEPRWLALHPSDKSLYVVSAFKGVVTHIDLRSGRMERVKVPGTRRFTKDGTIQLTPRMTGDPAFTPDGELLALASIYVDNKTPVDEPTPDGPISNGYASQGFGVSRFNPAVTLLPVKSDGDPRNDDDEVKVAFLVGDVRARSEFGGDEFRTVRSYPSSVTVAPDGMVFLVTLEASETVVALGKVRFKGRKDGQPGDAEPIMADTGGFGREGGGPVTSSEDGGFNERPRTFVHTDAGPRGVVFIDDDQAWVHNFIDRTAAHLDYDDVRSTVAANARDNFGGGHGTHKTGASVELTDSVLSAEVLAGQRLFYSAVDSKMAINGAGVSCSTCHFDGRNDGLTWRFEDHGSTNLRQTPSLAGTVSDTAPVTWTAGVESVAAEATITSQGRMGGNGLSSSDALNIQAYIDFTRLPLPSTEIAPSKVEQGKAIFNREDVGCADCHSGPAYTDGESYDLLGLEDVNTPTLLGISATAPYFHDGSAKTLREVLEQSRSNGMGNTNPLSDDEMDALEVFLRSL